MRSKKTGVNNFINENPGDIPPGSVCSLMQRAFLIDGIKIICYNEI